MNVKDAESALMNAHKAGDTTGATKIANWLHSQSKTPTETSAPATGIDIIEHETSFAEGVGDVAKGVGRGLSNTWNSAIEIGSDLDKWAGFKDEDYKSPLLIDTDETFGKTTTGYGSGAESVANWVGPGGAAVKGAKVAKGSKLIKGLDDKIAKKVDAPKDVKVFQPTPKSGNKVGDWISEKITKGRVYTPGNILTGMKADMKVAGNKALGGLVKTATGRPTGAFDIASAKIDVFIRTPARALASKIINAIGKGKKVDTKELDRVTKMVENLQKEVSKPRFKLQTPRGVDPIK